MILLSWVHSFVILLSLSNLHFFLLPLIEVSFTFSCFSLNFLIQQKKENETCVGVAFGPKKFRAETKQGPA